MNENVLLRAVFLSCDRVAVCLYVWAGVQQLPLLPAGDRCVLI